MAGEAELPDPAVIERLALVELQIACGALSRTVRTVQAAVFLERNRKQTYDWLRGHLTDLGLVFV